MYPEKGLPYETTSRSAHSLNWVTCSLKYEKDVKLRLWSVSEKRGADTSFLELNLTPS